MPTVKTVSVQYNRKINLGNYSSAEIECSIWADVTPEEDLDAAMRSMWAMAKNNVKAALLPLTQKDNAAIERGSELHLGLALPAPECAPAEIIGGGDHAA